MTAACCGQRPTGTAGGPLVNACQLCPTSPTYWRDQPPTPAPAVDQAPAQPAGPHGLSAGLDWSRHKTGPPVPCRLCGLVAVMRDEDDRPCHKVCAEGVLA